jgi:endonuclease III related protein
MDSSSLSNATKRQLMRVYEILFEAFGSRHWWPADSAEEVIFGAILAQNTAWSNVRTAISSLKNARKLTFKKLAAIEEAELAQLIRAARYFNQKAKTLKGFADYFGASYGYRIRSLAAGTLPTLRVELLGLYRIGPETADSILLYALEKPTFVIDAYTKRIFSRHGFLSKDESYEAFQKFFTAHIPQEVKLYNEYHALIVHTGYLYCKPKPLCAQCPLQDIERIR